MHIDAAGDKLQVYADEQGQAVYNTQVSNAFERLEIHHFSTENEIVKASVVERVNRKLRSKIQR